MVEIPPGEIPDVASLKETLRACLDGSETEGDRARAFFRNALSLLEKPTVPSLLIKDSNTKGLMGPCVKGTPYYAFMKAEGQSQKDSATATGSYGIGKLAPYAVSDLRTIFVSTAYADKEGDFQHLTQGKAILISHDLSGQRHRGTGFWGRRDRCQPVLGYRNDVPECLLRRGDHAQYAPDPGTSLLVLGFSAGKDWREILAASVAENFFGAIHSGSLMVDVQGLVIDSTTLQTLFSEDSVVRGAIQDEKGEPDHWMNCGHYYRALQDAEEVWTEEQENRELGRCRVRILVGDGYPKRVCVLRNGMFITDQLDGLKRFSDFKEFVAVVECLSDRGNELLREMEPPRHDDFEPPRLSTPDEQKRGQRALTELATWVRRMLKRHAKDPVSEVTRIDELAEYFGDEEEESAGGAEGDEVNPEGAIAIRAKPRLRSSVTLGVPRGEVITGDEGDESATKGGKSDGGDGGASSGAGYSHGIGTGTIGLGNVRAVPVDSSVRNVYFTPENSGTVRIRLEESGADADYLLNIVDTDNGELVEGQVELDVNESQRYKLCVRLAEEFTGALKVVAYEI